MKLKTLKDLNWSKSLNGHKKQVRDLAIKWVKFYEGYPEKEVDWKAVFIKVNNITEDDLNE